MVNSLITDIQTVTNAAQPIYQSLSRLQVALVWVQNTDSQLGILVHLLNCARDWNLSLIAYMCLSYSLSDSALRLIMKEEREQIRLQVLF